MRGLGCPAFIVGSLLTFSSLLLCLLPLPLLRLRVDLDSIVSAASSNVHEGDCGQEFKDFILPNLQVCHSLDGNLADRFLADLRWKLLRVCALQEVSF